MRPPASAPDQEECAGVAVESRSGSGVRACGRRSAAQLAGPSAGAAVPARGVRRIVMGHAVDEIARARRRNREERRIVIVPGCF